VHPAYINADFHLTGSKGYKFETLSLIPDFWDPVPRSYIESRPDQVVDNHAQYCSIIRTGFNNIKMVLGGEVDAGLSPISRVSKDVLIVPQ
jgi:hypothetical protein